MKKTIAFVLVILILVFSMNEGSILHADSAAPQGYQLVARNSILSLFLNSEMSAIAVEDRRNGYVWTSAVDDSQFDFDNVNDLWKSYMKSLFSFKHTRMDTSDCSIQTTCSTSKSSEVTVRSTKGGLILDYYFTNLEIGITLEIKIIDDALVIDIPFEAIKEDGKWGIISIELLPFFGAADHRTDGYVLYPDGCGALMLYQNIDSKPAKLGTNVFYVYGSDTVNITEYQNMEKNNKYQAMLPIFGVKNGDNAFIGITSKGESDTQINLSAEGNMVDINRTAFEYKYRHVFDIILSSITVDISNLADEFKGIKADKNLIHQDYEAKYVFLQGKNANYSGMADVYRDHLINTGGIKSVIEDDSPIPLAVDFLMGIVEDRLLFDKFIAMTSFEQAKMITENFVGNGVADLQVKLVGWARGGYGKNPVNWPPERRIGGAKGIADYSKYAKSENIDLFMNVNFVDALSSSGGFSKRNDVVFQGNNMLVTDIKKNIYLLNPSAAFNRFEKFLADFSKLGNIGLAFEETGKLIYHDYNRNSPSSRMQTMACWEKMLDTALQSGKGVAAEGGNAYTLKYADRLFGIPIGTSNYYITDEEVPFYQMVVHGLIPYTCDAGNLFYDPIKQKLKWIEYGCMPFYELTYKKSQEMKHTKYNKLFSSQYIDWIDTATSIYMEFNQRLGDTWNEQMTGHEKISKDLVKISYGSDIVVYINYSTNDLKHEGYLIKAEDYLVSGKDGVK